MNFQRIKHSNGIVETAEIPEYLIKTFPNGKRVATAYSGQTGAAFEVSKAPKATVWTVTGDAR